MATADLFFFNMKEDILSYDTDRSLLVCRSTSGNVKRWLKKLENITFIASIIEDSERYYVMGESAETLGEYHALDKSDGSSTWFIPGRAFFHIIHAGYLFLIFIDEKNLYWLLKVDTVRGTTIWHHRVDADLEGYRFRRNEITLTFRSGARTKLDTETGREI